MKLLVVVAFFLMALFGTSDAVCATRSTRQAYYCMTTVGGVNVHWTTDANNAFVTFLLDVPLTNSVGWAGLGWNTQPNVMIGSTAVIGTRTAAGAVTIGAYTLSAKVLATVVASKSNPGWLTTTQIASESGRLVISFRRVQVASGALNMVFAYGPSASISQHTAAARGTFQIVVEDGRAAFSPTGVPPTLSPTVPTPTTACTRSQLVISGTSSTYDCVVLLSQTVALHWTSSSGGVTSIAVAAAGITGWLGFSFPTVAGSMYPATAVASNSQIASTYQISSKSAAGIVATISDISNPTTEVVNGQRILRFNRPTSSLGTQTHVNFAYHTSLTPFPSSQHSARGSSIINFVAGTSTVVTLRDDDEVRTHAGGMIAIWAYWIPLAILIKVIGPMICNCEVNGLPLPYVLHFVMMFIGMALTTVFAVYAVAKFDNDVDYGHKELGIIILVLGWMQVLFGLSKPDNDSKYRKYWGWAHMLFGICVFILAAFQMGFGIKNYDDLYTDDDLRNDLLGAMIGGLSGFGLIYLVARAFVCMKTYDSSESESQDGAKDANI